MALELQVILRHHSYSQVSAAGIFIQIVVFIFFEDL